MTGEYKNCRKSEKPVSEELARACALPPEDGKRLCRWRPGYCAILHQELYDQVPPNQGLTLREILAKGKQAGVTR